MIKLIDGKGQIGEALTNLINEKQKYQDAIIYHTWNFLDKSEETQEQCYKKFKTFVDENKDSRIIFTSTYSETDNPYNSYKRLSESYLLDNALNGGVVRLPVLLGKGICQKFKENPGTSTFGEIELMTIEDAAKYILDFSQSEQDEKILRVEGSKIPAKIVKDLILFGKKEK